MNKIYNLKLTGKSDKTYDFSVYPSDNQFRNDVGGVYVFTKIFQDKSGDYKYDILYIGQTESFGRRLADHEKIDKAKIYGFKTIYSYIKTIILKAD